MRKRSIIGLLAGCVLLVSACHRDILNVVMDFDIPVASLELDQAALSLTEGENATLTATVSPDNATDKTVSWSSSDKMVVAVVGSGEILAIKPGTATITATVGDLSATCEVTVVERIIAVSSVELDNSTLSLVEGDSAQLKATVSPLQATDRTVTWSSSDEAVASVDANGKVTALTPGTATITATAGDQSATCEITVSKRIVDVTSVSLDHPTLVIQLEDSAQLTATVSPDDATDKTVSWSSSDATVASVDANGKVTALKIGTATITAKAGDQSATCKVTVKPIPVTSISLDHPTLEIQLEDSAQLTATVGPANATDKTVSWSSSDGSVASVDANGKVTGLKIGTATITAKAGDQSATCKVTVKPIPVTSISLDHPTLEIQLEDSAQLTATVGPANATDKTVSWSSSDGSVASVDANGKVTAGKAGTATITAKAGDQSVTCEVTVTAIPVTSISLDQTSLTMKSGDTVVLTATVGPANATDKTVSWSSSDGSVASVDANGKVTAGKAGTATITAKAGDKTATCPVLVTMPSGGPESVGEESWE